MRSAVLASLALACACTPDIAPSTYFCGPDASCPEGQQCNEADNKCSLAGLARPFECEPEIASEPDDSPEAGFPLPVPDCTSLPVVIDNCMLLDDPADWVRLSIPANCTTVSIDARITYPIAFEQLGLLLIDAAAPGLALAVDTACTSQGESGDELRCLAAELTGGKTYAIGVAPTGEGDCDGDCAFNRYTLRAQLK